MRAVRPQSQRQRLFCRRDLHIRGRDEGKMPASSRKTAVRLRFRTEKRRLRSRAALLLQEANKRSDSRKARSHTRLYERKSTPLPDLFREEMRGSIGTTRDETRHGTMHRRPFSLQRMRQMPRGMPFRSRRRDVYGRRALHTLRSLREKMSPRRETHKILHSVPISFRKRKLQREKGRIFLFFRRRHALTAPDRG